MYCCVNEVVRGETHTTHTRCTLIRSCSYTSVAYTTLAHPHTLHTQNTLTTTLTHHTHTYHTPHSHISHPHITHSPSQGYSSQVNVAHRFELRPRRLPAAATERWREKKRERETIMRITKLATSDV